MTVRESHCLRSSVPLFTALALVHCVAAAQDDAVPSIKQLHSMEARVQGCVTCHGQSGQGTGNGYFPRIAGKPSGYSFMGPTLSRLQLHIENESIIACCLRRQSNWNAIHVGFVPLNFAHRMTPEGRVSTISSVDPTAGTRLIADLRSGLLECSIAGEGVHPDGDGRRSRCRRW